MDKTKLFYSNIIFNGRVYKVDKEVVASRSSVIDKMFNNSCDEDRLSIIDPSISNREFDEFVKFLQTGHCDMDEENVDALFRLGIKYGAEEFVDKCILNIRPWIDKFNIFRFCELALKYRDARPLFLKEIYEILPSQFPSTLSHVLYGSTLISSQLVSSILKDCPRTDYLTDELIYEKVNEWKKLKFEEHGANNNDPADF